MTRHQYLWTTWQRLTSVGHCKLGEYVRIKLTGGSLENCRGPAVVAPITMPSTAVPATPSSTPSPTSVVGINQLLPQFSLNDSNGGIFRLIDHRGKIVLINTAGIVLDE